MRRLAFAASAVALAAAGALAQTLPQGADSYFAVGRAELEARLAAQPNTGRAKKLILFVGDGMSVATVTAARILEGQKRGVDGESNALAVDRLPHVALARTYSHDGQVSDSAPTATAMVTGVKTRNDVIGLDQTVAVGDCAGSKGHELTTLLEQAEAAGKATGVISTARITHATPAAMYAKTPNRDWEDDAETPAEAKAAGCGDIAAQLVAWTGGGDGFEVALGGGRRHFLPETAADPEDEGKTGQRKDGRDLTAEWVAKGNAHVFVHDAAGLAAVDLASGARVLGLFERSHMEYEADRADDKAGEPSIAEMTETAIRRLIQDEDGFVLMVEGGRIDHAHHAGNAARALEDAIAFDAALAKALELTDAADTLIVVTADHGHAFTINGYPVRGNPILGQVVEAGGETAKAADGKPYTTLSYANGPGSVFGDGTVGAVERPDLAGVETTDIDYLQQSLVPLGSETHSGDDVAVYASGPFAHLVAGTIEQNTIYHIMAHAMGAGE